MGKAIIIESPLCEVIIDGNKIQPPKRSLRSPGFKGFTQDDVNIAKSMVRIHIIEAGEERRRIEMRGVQLEVSECKISVEKLLERTNATELTFN